MKKVLGYFLMEFLSEIRDRETIIWSFMFPLVLFFILNISIGGVINQEENSISFRYAYIKEEGIGNTLLAELLDRVSIFEKKEVDNLKTGISYLKKDKVDIVIHPIPYGIGGEVELFYVKERLSSDLSKEVMEGILNNINLIISLTLQYTKYYTLKNFVLGAFNIDITPLIKSIKPFQYKVIGIPPSKNKKFSYKDYLFPGIMLMSLIITGAFGIPLKIAFHREGGFLKRLFVSPITPFVLFTGNFLAFLFIATIQFIILSLFSKYIMKVGINPFSWAIISYAMLTFLFSYTLGFFIATVAKTPQFANILGNALFFPLQFLGGLYFPVDNTPWIIKWFVLINPLTYISSGIRASIGLLSSPYPLYLSYIIPLFWIGALIVLIISKFSWIGEER